MTQYTKISYVAVLAAAVTLSACQGAGGPNATQTGGFLGGIAGGVLGSQFGEGSGKTAATIGGALLGVWAGSTIANSMNQQDKYYYNTASQQAYNAPIGDAISWNNPQSGSHGTITPTRDGYAQGGGYCREFQQSITVDGRTERAYGTACQQPDGTWRIVQ